MALTDDGRAYCDRGKRPDIALLGAVIYAIVYNFMINDTMFCFDLEGIYDLPYRLYLVSRTILIFYAVYTIIREQDMKMRAVYIVLVIPGVLFSNTLLILWAAFAGRSMKRWLPIGLGATCTVLGLAILSSILGIIDMGGHHRLEGVLCFGLINSKFPEHVMFTLIVCIVVLRHGIFKYYEYVALYDMIVIAAYIVRGRNGTICMLFLVTLCLICQIYVSLPNDGTIKKRIASVVGFLQKYLLDYFFIICYVIYMLCVYFREEIREFRENITWIRTSSFQHRIDMSAEVLQRPASLIDKLFGRFIYENGNYADGNITLDSFFITTQLNSGYVILAIILAVFTYFLIRARKRGERTIYIAIMAVALYSISDATAASWEMNFLVVLAFACWDLRSDGPFALPENL